MNLVSTCKFYTDVVLEIIDAIHKLRWMVGDEKLVCVIHWIAFTVMILFGERSICQQLFELAPKKEHRFQQK